MKVFPFGEKIQRLSELLKSEKEPRLERTVTEVTGINSQSQERGVCCVHLFCCVSFVFLVFIYQTTYVLLYKFNINHMSLFYILNCLLVTREIPCLAVSTKH